MSQSFVVTDARFTLFGNLIDGEKLTPEGESLESVFKSITGASPASTQRTQQPQIPTITASSPLRGNMFSIQLQPGRADILLTGAPSPMPSGPSIAGDFGDELAYLVSIGRALFEKMSDPNRIALAVGGAFTYEDAETPLQTFSTLTGISTDNDLTDPLYRVNQKSATEVNALTLNSVKSFEVGQIQSFEIIGSSIKVKEFHVLRCSADLNCDTFEERMQLDNFEEIVSVLVDQARRFSHTPSLHLVSDQ